MDDIWEINDQVEGELMFENHFDPFQPLPDRDVYLSKLERKLAKIKGTGKEPSPKDILKSLNAVKEDYLSSFNSNDNSNSTDDVVDENDPGKAKQMFNDLERSLFPNRPISNPEELEKLLKHDILAILTERSKNNDSIECKSESENNNE